MFNISVRMALVATIISAAAPLPALANQGLVHEGCSPAQSFTAGDITVFEAFSRATLPQARTGGGYMSITNTGSAPDRLIGAASEAAARIQLHRMHMEGDVMKMGEVDGGIELPAGETVTLEPGGLHVMFLGLAAPFEEGECVELTLEFERAGEVPVLLEIGGTAAAAAPHGHHH